MTCPAQVLLLTGTCGSGKSTVASLLATRGWVRVSEDEIWPRLFGKNRGAFGSDEHRAKRRRVHDVVFELIGEALATGQRVVVDATVHEAPPEAYKEYSEFFRDHTIAWRLQVLHPTLEVSVARDAARGSGSLGPSRVAQLYEKFTHLIFAPESFIDTSAQTPDETVREVLVRAA